MLIKRKNGEWYPLHDHELFEDRRFRMLGFSFDDEFYLCHVVAHYRARYAIQIQSGAR